MKKVKLSLIVVLAILGATICSFSEKSTLTAQWYGQQQDPVGGIYSTANPISVTTLNSKCPVASAHLCGAALLSDGTLDGSQSPNIRMSNDFFSPNP